MGFYSFAAESVKLLLLKILYAKCDSRKMAVHPADIQWHDEKFCADKNIFFTHGGGIGDILFSLHFCRELAEYYGMDSFNYYVLANTYDPVTRTGYNRGLSREAARFLIPLLEAQSCIKKSGYGAPPPCNTIELNDFRRLKINFASGDIRNWYYNLSRIHLPREFWKPVISVSPDPGFVDKVGISLTPRYRNSHIDCRKLEPFKDQLIFFGTPEEYADFTKYCFEIPRAECENMLVMAQYMAGLKGFIGNPGGIYSLAECMKIPRILLAPDFVDFNGVIIPGPHNVQPQGGWCEDVISDRKMVAAVDALMSRG